MKISMSAWAGFLLILLAFAGCSAKLTNFVMPDTKGSEPAIDSSQAALATFNYSVDGANYESDAAYPELNGALYWIGNNTPEGAVIAAWWDYGPYINAFANREAIVYTPSKEILGTVASIVAGKQWDERKHGPLSSHERIEDVALILTTTNPDEAAAIMKKYRSDYLLVTVAEYGKAYVIYGVSNITAEWSGEQYRNNSSVYYGMLASQPISRFELVYSDTFSVVYRQKSKTKQEGQS